MSSFTKPLTVTKIDARKWKVERSFIYIIDFEDALESIEIPKGFITDFASVPRAFWMVIPPDGKYTQAAVLHDFLYFTQTHTRKEADKIFLEAMAVLNVPWWKRRTMWLAVRMASWIPWNKRKNAISLTIMDIR